MPEVVNVIKGFSITDRTNILHDPRNTKITQISDRKPNLYDIYFHQDRLFGSEPRLRQLAILASIFLGCYTPTQKQAKQNA
ncbi:MAG: hypothetical protein WC744_02070 [Patescibacteria group bacterium]|jgi:hypothetical protein